MQITMQEFAERFGPSIEAQAWAEENCVSMREVWDKARPDWLVWLATREGVLTDRDLRLFGCWAVRQIWHLVSDPRSRAAVEVSERYAMGEATIQDLQTARMAAGAAWEAAGAGAAVAAAEAGASGAAWMAAAAAAAAAAWAAWDAGMAAWDAARKSAWEVQATYLRGLDNPFERDEKER